MKKNQPAVLNAKVRNAKVRNAKVRNAGAAAAIVNGKIKALELSEHLAVPICKIATVHGSGLDELIWTLPALAALRDSFPGARIISVARPALGAIFERNRFVSMRRGRDRAG